MGTLDGKVTVITGGTRGLGLAIARAYIGEGAAAVVASRSADAVKQTMTQLQTRVFPARIAEGSVRIGLD